ncbi:oxidoreductase [Maritalea porphyrae]|uniref:Oxidoreductase n=1 Tax=Maritalea porphyrae TaxID=880732 RepID=A0ABQ5UR56_9HYPH|nr:oxidoreductase [Maritalea porphyrae]
MSNVLSKNYDLAIIGGGVVGLWCAYFAQKSGLKTALFEANTIASGASGGLLGALMPHMPTQWNGKKQFQFDGLVELEDLVAEIEATTGVSCGYARVGRLQPLSRPEHLNDAQERCAAAHDRWQYGERQFEMRIVDEPHSSGWPDSDVMPHGAVFDDLSAHVNPRAVTAALLKSIAGQVDIFEHTPVTSGENKKMTLNDGTMINAKDFIVAAGLGSFDILKPFTPSLAGRPVKGQAALLDTKLDPKLPVLFQQGVYLIVHEDGRTAIGSTSEREFEDARATDQLLEDVIAKARMICPVIKDAPVAERWANLRMQPIGRDPLLGRLPDHDGVHIATGGFKIGFGIAHRMAQAVLAPITGSTPIEIPESFRIENRVNPA